MANPLIEAQILLEKANRWHKVGFLYAVSGSTFLIVIGVLANIAGFAGLNFLFAAITIITALYFLTKPEHLLTTFGFGAIVSGLSDFNLKKSLECGISALTDSFKPIGLLFLFVTVVFVTLATFPIANAAMVLPLIVILAGLKLTAIVQRPGYKMFVLAILLFSGSVTLYKMYVLPTRTSIVADEFLKMNQENLDKQKAGEIEKLREYMKNGGVLTPEQLKQIELIEENVNASKNNSFFENLNIFHSGNSQIAPAKEQVVTPQQVSEIVNQGNEKFVKGNYQGAIVDYTLAILLDPKNALAYRVRCKAIRNSTNKEEDLRVAIEDATTAIGLDPKNESGYRVRGGAKFDTGDYKGAIADATIAIGFDPNVLGSYQVRCASKLETGDHQGAIADATIAIGLDPNDEFCYCERGVAKNSIGDYQGAIADATIAIGLDPNNQVNYRVRGAAKLETGDYQGAIADYTKFIEINPKDASGYGKRGRAKSDLGDFEGAIADYTKAIELNPTLAMAYQNRAIAKHHMKNYQGAIQDYSDAIYCDKKLASSYFGRGRAKLEEGGVLNSITYIWDLKDAAKLGDKQAQKWLVQNKYDW